MLPVIEMFYSIQGEGAFVGTPSIFVRVSGCNLRCVFKGSMCDTPYTSFNPEKSKYNSDDEILDDIKHLLQENPKCTHIVFTGGEPMLYQHTIKYYIEVLKDSFNGLVITVETNGTIEPCDKMVELVDLFSVSPKLASSEDVKTEYLSTDVLAKHRLIRLNFQALAKYAFDANSVFKFVYSDQLCLCEIDDIYREIKSYLKDKRKIDWVQDFDYKTYLMPEGITQDQLNKKRLGCVEECLKRGWNFTDRLHITIWGDKRGV